MKYDQTFGGHHQQKGLGIWWVLAKLGFWLAFVVIFGTAFNYGLRVQAQGDCIEWQGQAETIPGFYLTSSQSNMCKGFGIEVDAKIK